MAPNNTSMATEQRCVLITGGAGYIGSHTTIEVLKAGFTAVVIDNLCNSNMGAHCDGFAAELKNSLVIADAGSSRKCIYRVRRISGQNSPFYQADVRDMDTLREIFTKHKISYVMHFAGLKAVGESCQKPLMYYKNNMESTFNLLEVMVEFEVFNIIFSSSATVYGVPQYLPVNEQHPAGNCTNPYGRTKYYVEQLLNDMTTADKRWNVVLLRYFNPAGSHESGLIGEDPQGPPNNLMPYVAQVSVGRREQVQVFGNDYDTPDGTGVRDYIHVVDLALGHVAALSKLEEKCGMKIYNLGTGQGYSVLDMIKAYEKASGKKIPYKMVGRRVGDVDSCYADPNTARTELGWTASRGLDAMCEDLWRWQSGNPQGFSVTNGHVKK